MKTWIAPAIAVALLAASPAAFAAPSDSAAQQDQHRDKKANAGPHDTKRDQSGSGHVAKHNNNATAHRTVRKRNVVENHRVTVRRRTEVHRKVTVKHPVAVHRNVHVDRRVFTAPHRYHWNVYHRPSGWYAHRWTYGERLPRGWFARDYWISSFLMFGLMAPPDGYVWVRVGDDALLIDEDTGEVVQVAYGVFY